ncbi:hypothetical protein ACGP04_08070 [Piscirickettsia salmonis]|uniref:hypothetical protein n=1 Tax=Piscirickettsia salmonis TaxID=1238 RepID=UPI000F078B49|nr:hypothetical protein DA717_03535 [Piscirickettsiaceae bacterium NZ-RLO2]
MRKNYTLITNKVSLRKQNEESLKTYLAHLKIFHKPKDSKHRNIDNFMVTVAEGLATDYLQKKNHRLTQRNRLKFRPNQINC